MGAARSRARPLQAAAGTVRADARAAARALRAVGITVSLAPVADVTTVAGAAMAGRAFGSGPRRRGRGGARVRRGLARRRRGRDREALPRPRRRAGEHGRRAGDRDADGARDSTTSTSRPSAPPWRRTSRSSWSATRATPAWTRARIASQSPAVIALLREDLGFRGVVVTDSMEAAASLATGTIEAASAARAGRRRRPAAAHRPGSYTPVRRALVAAARRLARPARRACARPPRACSRSGRHGARAPLTARPRHPAILHRACPRTPNIGVTCNVEVVRYGIWTEPAAMVPAHLRAGDRARRRASAPARSDAGRPRRPDRAARPPRRGPDHGRRRPRPVALRRRRRTPRPRRAPSSATLRADARPRRGRARPPVPRHLPRHADRQRGLRRRARPAPSRTASSDDIHRGAGGDFADHRVRVEPGSLAALAAGATRWR